MKVIDINVSKGKVFSSTEFNSDVVVAIGNFDGLHKGHEKLLSTAKKEAVKRQLPFGVITFDPHPRDFFSNSKNVFLLTDFLEKKRLFKKFGVDNFYNIRFNDNLRNLSPKMFIKLILKNAIKVKCIFAGENFRFGKDREGSFKDKKIFQEFMIDVNTDELQKNSNGEIISSELIRKSILNLDFNLVKSSLGREWAITGAVQKGDQNGRKLGFSTANIEISKILNPKRGVYFTNTRIMSEDGESFLSDKMTSITNFGIRPTIDGHKKLFETHILNYSYFFRNKEIYDYRIYVELLGFLREEKKFETFDSLKDQIIEDVKKAEQFHKK